MGDWTCVCGLVSPEGNIRCWHCNSTRAHKDAENRHFEAEATMLLLTERINQLQCELKELGPIE